MTRGARTPRVTAAPPRYRVIDCPHCGQSMRTWNGALLRYWRERDGLDQRTVARRLGISGPYLSDLERNRRDCPAWMFDAYRRALRGEK